MATSETSSSQVFAHFHRFQNSYKNGVSLIKFDEKNDSEVGWAYDQTPFQVMPKFCAKIVPKAVKNGTSCEGVTYKRSDPELGEGSKDQERVFCSRLGWLRLPKFAKVRNKMGAKGLQKTVDYISHYLQDSVPKLVQQKGNQKMNRTQKTERGEVRYFTFGSNFEKETKEKPGCFS